MNEESGRLKGSASNGTEGFITAGWRRGGETIRRWLVASERRRLATQIDTNKEQSEGGGAEDREQGDGVKLATAVIQRKDQSGD
jgi:hypothetical protein